ncbi:MULTISPECIES: MerR family DNA-binding transcriptional regulator [Streptomyces]|uniref:MerR family DNA-binding transcriptional regulator n=2 Tax=Streptomyces TaxID=1883 RepID=A0ABU2RFP8_9ACTN|nr:MULTISPECIES: MerR family transcriptional regulator [unclassified Streptomyces]MBK3595248.1 MerR family DNA-binding transcriptional regulator [Streptomyces sp. MBT51]MDT0427692.1 MerR family DNA-binding transcriptional regulator [Streptomyces sp. DSM 41770]
MDSEGRTRAARDAELVTIGEFARLSRLSAKALRRYDELGLVPPALVDPVNGYRYYDRARAGTARLVAWLRRIGMPLARIAEVTALDDAAAAAEIRAYWARVEAETAARRELAAFLVDRLSAKENVGMGDIDTDGRGPATLGIRYAALAHPGAVRGTQQDTAYAGARLLAVADGFGAAGAEASAAAVDALKPAARGAVDADDLLGALQDAADGAARAVREAVTGGGAPAESGSTLTALVWTGSRLGLVHIGDSRAYVLRDGRLLRITHDHTLVQSMIDDGSLTEEEAASHPRRMLLLRALAGDDGEPGSRPEVRLHDTLPGDRYLLCSDGLSSVVDEAALARAVAAANGPDAAVRDLVALAGDAEGPDNVSCVVADVVAL